MLFSVFLSLLFSGLKLSRLAVVSEDFGKSVGKVGKFNRQGRLHVRCALIVKLRYRHARAENESNSRRLEIAVNTGAR